VKDGAQVSFTMAASEEDQQDSKFAIASAICDIVLHNSAVQSSRQDILDAARPYRSGAWSARSSRRCSTFSGMLSTSPPRPII
jgi:hypothetical protein